MTTTSKVERLSSERKQSILDGRNPEWLTTPGYQMLVGKYLTKEDPDLKSTFRRISRLSAQYMKGEESKYEDIFYNLLWSGDFALSTPPLANMGTGKAMVVSCTGNLVDDSVGGFYEATMESAVLSQEGFGTSSYLGDIRPRGSDISRGGKASGTLPVIKQFVQMARDITQGTRRGAWAGYLEITHGDFWEIVSYLEHNPEDFNMGWIIPDSFIDALSSGDEEANRRYSRALKVKLVTGKGYFLFIDRANRNAPQAMRDAGLTIKASNLCTEIMLPSSDIYSFGCLISSMNLARYDEWQEDAIFNSMIFLDCMCDYFLDESRGVKGVEKVHNYMLHTRSVGLGLLGFHTMLQKKSMTFGGLQAHMLNNEVAKLLDSETMRASKYLAILKGEPKLMKGTGQRFMHRMTIAPNTSSAIIAGSVSAGIAPIYANAFIQSISGGEVSRVNPELITVMKQAGVYNEETVKDILKNDGSVQHVEWLTDHQKDVFKTAFELNQADLVRLASQRQRYLDQGQSLDLYFPAGTSEEYISKIHKMAFTDKYLLALYYIRSSKSNKASSGECTACAS